MRRQLPPVTTINQTLPAAGAEVVGSALGIPPSAATVTIWVTYTRASVTGYPRLQFRWDTIDLSRHQGVTISGTTLIKEYWDWTGANDSTVERMALKIDVPDGAQQFYLVMNEQGDTANAGAVIGRVCVGVDV